MVSSHIHVNDVVRIFNTICSDSPFFFILIFSSYFICGIFRFKMFSLADASGQRTALVALRNCLYLVPLGYLAYDCKFLPTEEHLYILVTLLFLFMDSSRISLDATIRSPFRKQGNSLVTTMWKA